MYPALSYYPTRPLGDAQPIGVVDIVTGVGLVGALVGIVWVLYEHNKPRRPPRAVREFMASRSHQPNRRRKR